MTLYHVWPDDTVCTAEELHEMRHKSDDYLSLRLPVPPESHAQALRLAKAMEALEGSDLVVIRTRPDEWELVSAIWLAAYESVKLDLTGMIYSSERTQVEEAAAAAGIKVKL